MRVKDVMVREVTTVAPETSLRDVATILAERGISGLPVVDGAGRVIGVVSEADILLKEMPPPEPKRGVMGWLLHPAAVAEATSKLTARTAGDAMTSPAITVDANASVARAAAVMTERGINRLPVVKDDALIGIVTRADLVRAFTRSDAEIAREIRDEVILRMFWIAPETVNVDVRQGVVKLGGEVEKRSLAGLLEAFVARVPGVLATESTLGWREDDRP